MMAFTGHENVDDIRYHLARRLYTAVVMNASILKLKDVLKIPDLEKIVLLLKKRSQWSGVRAFLQLFPCFFLVTDENGQSVIKPIVTIEFCRAFDGKRGCGKTFCSRLHVCRHFVKGKCTFGGRCKKPHHFQNGETREVLKKHFLDELNDEQTREFLCRNVQHLLDPETANVELPKALEICKYYNVATGCTREFCPFIHVCRFFAEEGNCKFGSQCIRKHDINNVHSRILLHRYQMDHLNEPQVMAYLKIKGETRDQQQQQQQQQPQASQKFDKSQGNSPTLMPSFSLPNSFLSNIHAAIVNDIGRKLSQPTSGHNGLPLMDDGSNTRKLSLPTPPISRPMLCRQPVNLEGNHVNSSNLSCPNREVKIPSTHHENNVNSSSFSPSMDNCFAMETYYKQESPTLNRHGSSSPQNSHSDSFMEIISNNLNQKLMLSTNKNASNGLGLTNLSQPATACPATVDFGNNITASSLSSNSITSIVFSKSRSFSNFPSSNVDIRNKTCNGMSKSFQANCSSYSNSIPDQSHSFFTSRIPFMRASSNDIISPTGSVSSINGTPYVNGTSTGSLTSHENDWHDSNISKSLKSHDENGDFLLSCYRTKSLPNFRSLYVGNNVENATSQIDRGCTCHKNEICIFHLRGVCRFLKCKRQHTDETFQWQISSSPVCTKRFNGYKNENEYRNVKHDGWVNVDKNENLKIESAYCSPEIEESEIEYFGDFLTVNFNEMVGIARSEINLTNGHVSPRSCDLSAWLLQSNDETSNRRNSQEKVVYNVRRVSTRSTVVEEFDLFFATQWLWFWQDSFGIWRKYPTSKTEVIDTTSTCYSDEIENRFLEGHDQFIFEETKLLVDYKNMTQVNCLTRKQRKIRRRPRFICKEQREHIGSFSEPLLPMNDVRRPWYWNKDPSLVNRPYDLIDVASTSDTYTTVCMHITRSIDKERFEILSIKSVQNIQLWSKFMRLRRQFEQSHIKYSDKFVFKDVSQENLSGVCQQGFPICACKHRRHLKCDENKFATEAVHATEKKTSKSVDQDGIHYIFCARITIPISDVIGENSKLSSSSDEDSNANPVLKDAWARHSHQVYPEFLIVLKLV